MFLLKSEVSHALEVGADEGVAAKNLEVEKRKGKRNVNRKQIAADEDEVKRC